MMSLLNMKSAYWTPNDQKILIISTVNLRKVSEQPELDRINRLSRACNNLENTYINVQSYMHQFRKEKYNEILGINFNKFKMISVCFCLLQKQKGSSI